MSADNRLYHLDTLRAVAILLVLLFHFKIPGFSAGYLGVDLFMLLSGFLMTYTMLHRRQREGFFNVKSFYWRRFVRIVPSLLITISAGIIAAYLVFAPNMLFRISKEAFYAQTFTSNFYYYKKSGYFDPSAYERLFIHTWSLSVEEQYYIIFGIIMILSFYFSFKKMMIGLFYLSALISVSTIILIVFFNDFFYENFPKIDSATFYLLPYRMILFQVGSIYAYFYFHKNINKIERSLPIIIIFFFLSIYFIGRYEIPPFLASIMVSILWSPLLVPSKLMESIGKTKLVSFISKTSYQTYLAHWPILIIYLHIFYKPLQEITEKAFLFLLSMIAGWILWKINSWIIQTSFSPRHLIHRSLAILLSSFLMQGIAIADKGAYWRIPQHREHETSKQAIVRTRSLCTKFTKDIINSCTIKKGDRFKTIYIVGDSHTENLMPGLSRLLDVNLESLFTNGCPPIAIHRRKKRNGVICNIKKKRITHYLSRKKNMKIILTFKFTSKNDDFPFVIENMKRYTDLLRQKGHDVLWLAPIPYPGINLPYCLSAPYWFTDSFIHNRCQSLQEPAMRVIKFNKLLKESMGIPLIDTTTTFCSKKGADYRCIFTDIHGKSLFRDGDHLNIEGSEHLARNIVHKIQNFVFKDK